MNETKPTETSVEIETFTTGHIKHRPIDELEEIASRPYRHIALHWAAFVLSLVSLGLLVTWLVVGPQSSPPFGWILLDIALGAVFIVEFFSRSGFRWSPVRYIITHFFDFIAIVPVLALVNHQFPGESVWVWIIVAARAIRSIDRLLGDGFVRRNILALIEGFEEAVTDRVLLHIMIRIQEDLDRGHFGRAVAEAMQRNKSAVLQRIAAEHPLKNAEGGLAFVGGLLDSLLKRTEERAYDAVVDTLKSSEVDNAIRDTINSLFANMMEQMGNKRWRQHLGIRRGASSNHTINRS